MLAPDVAAGAAMVGAPRFIALCGAVLCCAML